MTAILIAVSLISAGVGIYLGAYLTHGRNQYLENLNTIQRNALKEIIQQYNTKNRQINPQTIQHATLILIQSIDNEDHTP